MKIRLISFVFSILATSTASYAESMRCKFEAIYTLGDGGEFLDHPISEIILPMEAIVDLSTGVVYHPAFGNEGYDTRQILDGGSSASSFKVIAYSRLSPPRVAGENGFRNFTMFQIQTYFEGATKPFVTIEGSSIGSGICQ